MTPGEAVVIFGGVVIFWGLAVSVICIAAGNDNQGGDFNGKDS